MGLRWPRSRRARRRRCDNAGVALEVLSWEGAHGAMPAALLVPGMAASAAAGLDDRAWLRAVSAAGARRVLAVSLRGRGGSDCPDTGWSLAHHVADLDAALRAEGVQRCHAIGHSVGGFYAAALALEHPAVVASVTIGDHPPVLPRRTSEWVRRLHASGPHDVHPRFAERIIAEAEPVDLRPRLPSLAAPLLVLQASDGTSLLPDDGLSGWGGAQCHEVLRVPGGHEDVFGSAEARAACTALLARADE